MKAIFSPSPSYFDPQVKQFAGWWHIQDLYRQALDELGFDILIPEVSPELVDASSTVAKMASYDLVAASQILNWASKYELQLFMGPGSGYSLAQMMVLPSSTKKLVWVWNNADWWRDQQLAEEYKKLNAHYDLSPSWRWVNQKALEISDHVIACSPWVKWSYSKVVPENKIDIAFWGIDSGKFTPASEEPLGFRILFVGGDPIRKGLFYLMRALDSFSDYELWIVGCKPFAELHPNWKQFGMLPHDQMPDIYPQCHVLVCPTLEDGIALCVQEAMASGLVPIGSPDVAEVFNDGVSGFKVAFRDVQGIKEKLEWLQNNPDSRRNMAKEAMALAKKQTWDETKEQVKEIVKRGVE